MSEANDNLVLEILKKLQADMSGVRGDVSGIKDDISSIKKQLGSCEKNISVLADGMLSMRRDVQTLAIASAGHGERLAEVEVTLSELKHIVGLSSTKQ